MSFTVKTFAAKAGDRSGTGFEMTNGSVRAEVWPDFGFNCLRWQVRQADGSWAGVIFTSPEWETNPVPTRSGHPILFPFPGRLRDGRMDFQGKTYQLPLNDSTKQHAIHGFTPRTPWRVTDSNGDTDFAFVTGQFQLSKDLPSAAGQWPADFKLNVTYRLYPDKLRVDAVVENLGPGPLPFGLGYHPYFRLPGVADADIGGHVLQANVAKLWEAVDNLPTGKLIDPPAEIDFRKPKPIDGVALDNVFGAVTAKPSALSGLAEVARLTHPDSAKCVKFLFDGSFQNLVLFIPAHRQAVAVEPYTCSADAANLAAPGVDTGWLGIREGATWESAVEYRYEEP